MVDNTFLTGRRPNGKSISDKLHHSYRQLRDPDRPPRLELLTNRVLDQGGPFLGTDARGRSFVMTTTRWRLAAASAQWIRSGQRVLTADDVCKTTRVLGVETDRPRAVLLVQAIDRDPHPEDAAETVDISCRPQRTR